MEPRQVLSARSTLNKPLGDSGLCDLTTVLRQMLGPGIAAATAAPRLVCDELFSDELRYIGKAVQKRRAEFGTARVCARHALSELGIEPCSLAPNPDRSPSWPTGVRGTIAHSAHRCAAAVTNLPEITGIGLDLEEDTPLLQDLESVICTAAERQWLQRFSLSERARLGKVFFSAKEAFYKCQYDTSRAFITFQDVTLELDRSAQSFRVGALLPSGNPWDRVRSVTGRFHREHGLVITTALLVSR